MNWVDILTVATFFVGGVIIGAFYVYKVVMHNVSENPRKMIEILEKIERLNAKEQQIDQEDNNSLNDIKTEVYHGITYLFDKDTDEFLAQGTSFDDALKIANKRFPNRFSVKVAASDSQSS